MKRGTSGEERVKLPDGYKTAVKKGMDIEEGDVIAKNPDDSKAKDIKAPAGGHIQTTQDGIIIETFEGEKAEYSVPVFTKFRVKAGDEVKKGDQLTEGNLNLHDLLRISGRQATWQYMIKEVQDIYASQAQYINDKHIEIVVREMLSKVRVAESGDTNLIPSEVVNPGPGRRGQREDQEIRQGTGYHRAADPRDHQGVAGDRVVPLGRFVPGDHPSPDRRRRDRLRPTTSAVSRRT